MINAQTLIEMVHQSELKRRWEMDYETYQKIRKIYDDTHTYLWKPELTYLCGGPGTLLDIPIVIVESKGLQLRCEFSSSIKL